MTGEQHKRVLVADDDAEVRNLLFSVLMPRGLVVDLAADGTQALAFLRENNYSVVLLDLLMPSVDGFGVLDVLQTEALQSPPVVLVLTGAESAVVERLDPQRIHGLVRKPFDPLELASLVVACSDIRGRGNLGTMAIAMMSGAPFLVLLKNLRF